MSINIGNAIRSVTKLDPTPNFQINKNTDGLIPFIGRDDASLQSGYRQSGNDARFADSLSKLNSLAASSRGSTGNSGDSGAYTNSGGYGGSGGGSAYSAQDYAALDGAQNDAQSQLSRLDQQLGIGQGNIQSAYTNSLNQLLGQKAVTDRNYSTSKDQTKQDYVQSRGNIQAQVGQQSNALQKLLGSHGYSGSGNVAANYGAAREGSLANQGVQQTYGRNQQALDTNYGDYNNQFQSSVGGLDAQKRNQENQLQSSVASNRQTLLGKLAEISQARTGNAAAGQGYRDQINQLGGQIDQLGAQYQNPAFNVQQPTYQAPSLSAYDTPQRSTPQLETAPGAGDSLNPFLSVLLNQQDKRKTSGIA